MLALDEQRHILREGVITVEGRIVDSSNQALLVTVTSDGQSALACYKAAAGERPLWDFPDGLWRREVAAFELDQLLGNNMVPTTVVREDGPFGEGSLQWWISDVTDDHYFTLRDAQEHEEILQRLATFDVVANNADRKAGHVLYDAQHIWAIDHGLCFHDEDKLRTVIWDFAGRAWPASLRDPLSRLAGGELGALSSYLTPDECAQTIARAAQLVATGCLPLPDLDREWPPYPWPLV